MRERLLTQHFVRRFLENDLVSPDADRHEVLSLVGAGLLSSTMFITIGLALKFMFMPLQSPGRTAILAVDDRLLFLACAMIVMALVAVTAWDAPLAGSARFLDPWSAADRAWRDRAGKAARGGACTPPGLRSQPR